MLNRDVAGAEACMLQHIRKSQARADQITLAQLSEPARNPFEGTALQ